MKYRILRKPAAAVIATGLSMANFFSHMEYVSRAHYEATHSGDAETRSRRRGEFEAAARQMPNPFALAVEIYRDLTKGL